MIPPMSDMSNIAPPPAAAPPPPPPSLPMGGPGGASTSLPTHDGPQYREEHKPPPRGQQQQPSRRGGQGASRGSPSRSSLRAFQGCLGAGPTMPSYQNDAFVPSITTWLVGRKGTRAAADPPTIENYGTDDDLASTSFDPSLNPNRTGVANSAEGAGTALPELVLRMRVINLVLCTLAIGLEVPMWIQRALILDLGKLILGIYLCFFAGLLCCFELHTPVIADAIKSNFAIVYHPHGRALFLALMGGMCIGQGGLEFILGCVMMLNAVYTIYIACRYPAYEKAHEDVGREDAKDVAIRAARRAKSVAWANPEDETKRLVGR